MKINPTALLAALAMTAATSAQADFIIDDWSTSQGPYFGHSWNQTQTGDMLSGTRRTFQQNTTGLGEVFGEIANNRLSFSATNGARSFFTTYWDGADRNGTGPHDFTQGGKNDRLRFDTYETNGSTSSYSILAKLNDGSFTRANIDFSIQSGAHSGAVEVMFSDFDASTDFTSVLWIALDFGAGGSANGAATHVSFGKFHAVPTPASAMLLGLAGLATTKRRR